MFLESGNTDIDRIIPVEIRDPMSQDRWHTLFYGDVVYGLFD